MKNCGWQCESRLKYRNQTGFLCTEYEVDPTDLHKHHWDSPKDIHLEVWESKTVDPKEWMLHIDFIRDLSVGLAPLVG